MGDKAEPWILEIGHHSTRFGRAGDVKPAITESSYIGAPKVPDHLSLKETGLWPLSAENKLDHTSLIHPLTGSKLSVGESVPNNEALYTILKVCAESMGGSSWKGGKCLVIEPTVPLRGFRDILSELLFEQFEVESLLFQKCSPLALYACARTSGISIDLGHEHVAVSSVLEGVVPKNGAGTLRAGGRAVIREFLRGLGMELPPLYEAWGGAGLHHPFVETDYQSWAVEKTGESLLFASSADRKRLLGKLPDGQTIGKYLNDFDIASFALRDNGMSLGELFESVARSSGISGVLDLMASPVVSGGLAQSDHLLGGVRASIKEAQGQCTTNPDFMGGLPCVETNQWEIGNCTPLPWGWRLLHPKEPSERAMASFIGGSILGSLSVFDAVAVDRKVFLEIGAKALSHLP